MAFDIYQEVTDRIIAEMENGIIPWQKPWTGTSDCAISHSIGRPYSIINQFLLRDAGEYITFNECKAEGGKIKKGAKARMVIFWKVLHVDKKDNDGNAIRDESGKVVQKLVPMLRYYNVFHIDDTEGIEPKWENKKHSTAEEVESAEAVINNYAERAKLTIEHCRQDRAYYRPSTHAVSVPLIEQFDDTEGYYATLFHELVHSTGHKTLLNRFEENGSSARFGSEPYAREELVAEIGCVAITNRLGLETKKSFRNDVAYIQSWIAALKNDKRLIISAASRAEKAFHLILNDEMNGEKIDDCGKNVVDETQAA